MASLTLVVGDRELDYEAPFVRLVALRNDAKWTYLERRKECLLGRNVLDAAKMFLSLRIFLHNGPVLGCICRLPVAWVQVGA